MGHENLWLMVSCVRRGCGHSAAVPLVPLIIRWGTEDRLRERILRAFICSHCGGRQITTCRASWGGMHVEWVPIPSGPQRWTGAEVYPGPLSLHYLDDRCYGWFGEKDFHPVLGELNFNTMCNLYSNTRSRDEIRGLFRVSANRAYAFEPMSAIFPKSVAPIVRLAADGEREMVPATWGFPLLKQGYAPKPVTNVRDDTVLTSPFWRPSFDARRCLVPASSYCEPDSNKPAGWHWFGLLAPRTHALADRRSGDLSARGASGADASGRRPAFGGTAWASEAPKEERPLFAFPGVWKRYRGPLKKDGEPVDVDVYAFLTTAPNALTATIMHDRMPVLLSDPAAFDLWLTGTPEQAYSLVRTYDANAMHIVQSGAEKQDLLGTDALH